MVNKSVQSLEDLIERDREHSCDGLGPHKICVRVVAIADLPTRYGHFKIIAFSNTHDAKEHVAIVHGDIINKQDVPTRVHSECFTGDVVGSLRCDCRDQWEQALLRISEMPCGLLLYLRQEGRGIGLVNKVRAYSLQDQGLDTIDANLALGFRDDERDYAIAAHMIKSLNVQSIQLLTNNPNKIRDLANLGIQVNGRIPHIIPPNEHNRFYLQTKARRFGHFIDFAGKPRLPEQSDPVVVEGMPESKQR